MVVLVVTCAHFLMLVSATDFDILFVQLNEQAFFVDQNKYNDRSLTKIILFSHTYILNEVSKQLFFLGGAILLWK